VDGSAGQAQSGAFTAIAGSSRNGAFFRSGAFSAAFRFGGKKAVHPAAPGAQAALPVQAVCIRHFGSIKKMLLFTKAWGTIKQM
jgi:hypothetical protein